MRCSHPPEIMALSLNFGLNQAGGTTILLPPWLRHYFTYQIHTMKTMRYFKTNLMDLYLMNAPSSHVRGNDSIVCSIVWQTEVRLWHVTVATRAHNVTTLMPLWWIIQIEFYPALLVSQDTKKQWLLCKIGVSHWSRLPLGFHSAFSLVKYSGPVPWDFLIFT